MANPAFWLWAVIGVGQRSHLSSGLGTGSVWSHAVLGRADAADCSCETANQHGRLQLLSFCQPLHGLRDQLYLLTRATPCSEQLCGGSARSLLPPDLLP